MILSYSYRLIKQNISNCFGLKLAYKINDSKLVGRKNKLETVLCNICIYYVTFLLNFFRFNEIHLLKILTGNS